MAYVLKESSCHPTRKRLLSEFIDLDIMKCLTFVRAFLRKTDNDNSFIPGLLRFDLIPQL